MTARVLLVDDSRVNISLLSAKLVLEYYQVLEAHNGFDALAYSYTWQPDLILLDIMMPGMDGYECCSYLKSEMATSDIPVVMITALNEPDQRNRGLAVGADDFLTKPVDYELFGARVRSLTRLRRILSDYFVHSNGRDADFTLRQAHSSERIGDAQTIFLLDIAKYDALYESLAEGVTETAFPGGEQEFLCLVAVLEFSICVMSLQFEGSDPLRLISALRASDKTRELPILTVTPRSRKNQILAAFSLGASDCLFEPVDTSEMMLRIRNQLRRAFFRLNLKNDLDHAVRSALVDPLTGVFNKLYLSKYTRYLEESAARFSILMIDVDHFKSVNDRLGHPYGDQVLIRVADAIKRHVRGDDAVIRFGGEEFLVIMQNAGMLEAKWVAERLRGAVEALRLPAGAIDLARGMTISIGVAQSDGAMCDFGSVVAEADAALYSAKRNGRNRVEMNVSRPKPPLLPA